MVRALEIMETPLLIEELISNLIDNAIQHSPSGSEITVTLTIINSTISLQISDNGHGIPPDEIDNVFKRFYRLDSSKSTSSGLGLSIVKEICEFIGATITLSRPQMHDGLQAEIVFGSIANRAM